MVDHHDTNLFEGGQPWEGAYGPSLGPHLP